MAADVRLQTIQFGSGQHKNLSEVRCELSNKIKSPLFTSEGGVQGAIQRIAIKHNKPVRQVQVIESEGHGISRINLLNHWGKEISSFPAYGEREISGGAAIMKISKNEELIGVYGVKGKEKYFTSFGFILKINK